MPSDAPPSKSRLLLTSRPSTVGSPLAMLIHDMNNKTTAILGNLACFEGRVEHWRLKYIEQEVNRVRGQVEPIFERAKHEVSQGLLEDNLGRLRGRLKRVTSLLPEPEEVSLRDCYNDIIQAAEDFDAFVAQGKQLSEAHMTQEKPTLGDISQCVSAIVNAYQKRFPNIHFYLIIDGACITSFCPQDIKRALENLLNNAIQSLTENGGEISVNLKMKSYDAAETPFSQIEGGTYINLEISDNGSGIPEDIMSRLSEAHFSTKQGGSGLGLISASNNIAKHKGHLFIESEVGHGTKVTALIPSLPPPAMACNS
jgi:signal transduction histidine kinase